MTRNLKRALITDFDNTLFDWVDVWFRSFSAMLKEISRISEIDERFLKSQIRAIHQRHGTSEYSFVIEEIPALQTKYGQHGLAEIFSSAIEAYRAQRRTYLTLYPTVADTLLRMKGSGAIIVCYTESMAFYSNYRVRRLGLDGVFDYVFSPEDHDIPMGLSPEEIRSYPMFHYKFRYTVHEHTARGSKKPDPDVLRTICKRIGVDPDECVCVGDSLWRDVAMAQRAGISDVWAKYGQANDRAEYDLLRELTHWSSDDVERERKLRATDVVPSVILEHSFSELLDHFELGGSRTGIRSARRAMRNSRASAAAQT